MNKAPQSPTILREGEYSDEHITQLRKEAWAIRDIYRAQLTELFEIENPSLLFTPDFLQKQDAYVGKHIKDENLKGNWVYFPWSGVLLHTLREEDYHKLRSNRNQNLITSEEQSKIALFAVAVVGLSVGSNIAVNLAYLGVNRFKLCDFDVLETTNLNRVRGHIDQVGEQKIAVASQQIYEINPYAHIQHYVEGLSDSNLDDFIMDTNLIFEIIDDFKMKIKLRFRAREQRIPVVMMTNLGDSVLIDVERYDVDSSTQIFNGLIGNIGEEILEKEITKEDEKRYAVQIVGRDNVPPRALASLPEIGKTLVGRPQLMTTVSVSGGLAGYVARKIALGEHVPSGRRLFQFEDIV
jgi:hypothetical protein